MPHSVATLLKEQARCDLKRLKNRGFWSVKVKRAVRDAIIRLTFLDEISSTCYMYIYSYGMVIGIVLHMYVNFPYIRT